MAGFLSGTHYLPCFGGPACGQSHHVRLTDPAVVIATTFVHGEEGERWTVTLVARYRPLRIYVGQQPRWVLKWLPEG